MNTDAAALVILEAQLAKATVVPRLSSPDEVSRVVRLVSAIRRSKRQKAAVK